MKSLTLAFAVALAAAAPTYAQSADAVSEATAAEPSGTIIIYRRGSLVGSAVACPIRYKGAELVELVELGRSKAFEWKVQPGRYILENKSSSIEVSVEAGETRYVRCQMKSGFLTSRADLQIVDGTEYADKKDGFEQPGA